MQICIQKFNIMVYVVLGRSIIWGLPKKFVSLPVIILFVFAETKIIKKADSHNRNQPKFLLFKKFLEDSSNIKK